MIPIDWDLKVVLEDYAKTIQQLKIKISAREEEYLKLKIEISAMEEEYRKLEKEIKKQQEIINEAINFIGYKIYYEPNGKLSLNLQNDDLNVLLEILQNEEE